MRQYSLPIVFSQGFTLATKSFDVFLVGLVLSLLSLIVSSIQDALLATILQVVSFVLLIINISFMLSTPVFLVKKQQNKVLHYKNLWEVVFKNTKRIILPGILLFIIFMTILVALFVFAASTFDSTGQQISYFFGDTNGLGLIPIVFMIGVSVFEFTSFFFSLENNSLLLSIKKSIGVAFRNIPYIGIIIFTNITSYILSSLFLSDGLWRQCIGMALGGYLSFVLSASSLVYYQRIVKKQM
jgi:hypothetical protein